MSDKITWTFGIALVLAAVTLTAGAIIFAEEGNAAADFSVDGHNFNDALASVTDAESAMQSTTPGVQILNNSGTPGQGAQIRVRGAGSLNGDNAPLYVVDGIVRANINDLNPADIESMTVLKGAEATSLYGSRAASGVIIITCTNDEKEQNNESLPFIGKELSKFGQDAWYYFGGYFANLAEKFDIVQDKIVSMTKLYGKNYQKKVSNYLYPVLCEKTIIRPDYKSMDQFGGYDLRVRGTDSIYRTITPLVIGEANNANNHYEWNAYKYLGNYSEIGRFGTEYVSVWGPTIFDTQVL